MKKPLLFAACAALFATSFVAKAATMITNMSESSDYWASISETGWRAQKFKTDASAATFTLDSVVLKIGNSMQGGNFFVKIYNTAGSEGVWLPDNSSVLGTLTGNADPFMGGDCTYTASGITLQASTNYWIVAGVSSGSGSYEWIGTNSTTTTGAWSITATNTTAESVNSGSNWTSLDGRPLMFAVNATAVPEPSGVLLLMAGGGVLAFVRRRQVRKA